MPAQDVAKPPPSPAAAQASIQDALDLLDGAFAAAALALGRCEYALWLGSGISRDRIVGLDGVLRKLIEHLRTQASAQPDCAFQRALDEVIALAQPTASERKSIDYARDSKEWLPIDDLLVRLAAIYAKVLDVRVDGQSDDYLLWEGVDFAGTFASLEPDAEHISVGVLVLERAVTQIASANWDGLLEAAAAELGHDASMYRVCVTGSDVRGPGKAADLYKYHGCALRAIDDPNVYRSLVIARAAQILLWGSLHEFAAMRTLLTSLAVSKRTLMIGLSAQDTNIQQVFANAASQAPWTWCDDAPAMVFAEDELNAVQKTLLQAAYGSNDYANHRKDILARARFPAFAKALLPAAVLHVLCQKIEALARLRVGSQWSEQEMEKLSLGLRRLRNLAASAGDHDRLAFVRRIVAQVTKTKAQLQVGEVSVEDARYTPITPCSVHEVVDDSNLRATGQSEASVSLGLIGLGELNGSWSVSIEDSADVGDGAVRLATSRADARIIFVANDMCAVRLMKAGVYTDDDDDVVLVHSNPIVASQQRSPSARRRSGGVGVRHIDMDSVLGQASDLTALVEQFNEGLGL